MFMWKSTVFWFCKVSCLHTRCEMRHFYTLRCPAHFWLIQCKPYQNRFIIAKVINKSLGARFLWPTVYVSSAYFIRLLVSLTTLRSPAAITYDAGPTPEPWTILAVIVFSVDTWPGIRFVVHYCITHGRGEHARHRVFGRMMLWHCEHAVILKCHW